MSRFKLENEAAAGISNPAAGKTVVFVDTDKLLKTKDDTGTVTNYGAAGSAITSLTGEVTASGPGAAAATVSNAAVIAKLLTGLSPVSGTLAATDSILDAFNKLAAKNYAPWLPTASDGDVVISSDTTLVRDMYYNSLTVNVGVTLYTGGFRILSATTIVNNGTIDRSGNSGIVNAAGAALAAGSLGASSAGGAGGTAAGTAGAAVTFSLGAAGGAGGAGSGGAGGAGGAVTVITAANGGLEVLQNASRAYLCRDLAGVLINGGSGGGGGGGDLTAGGGGGSGGGVLLCVARSITGSGSFKAMGGNGGTPTTGNRGGGAGGGGGVVVLISENDTSSLTVNVSGGLGSSGTGTGATGNNGSVGRVYRVRF